MQRKKRRLSPELRQKYLITRKILRKLENLLSKILLKSAITINTYSLLKNTLMQILINFMSELTIFTNQKNINQNLILITVNQLIKIVYYKPRQIIIDTFILVVGYISFKLKYKYHLYVFYNNIKQEFYDYMLKKTSYISQIQ